MSIHRVSAVRHSYCCLLFASLTPIATNSWLRVRQWPLEDKSSIEEPTTPQILCLPNPDYLSPLIEPFAKRRFLEERRLHQLELHSRIREILLRRQFNS